AYASLIVLVALYVVAVVGPVAYPRNPYAVDPPNRLMAPGPGRPLGTDDVGRDILARILYGGRVSLTIGLVALSIAVCIGTLIGASSGYFEGWIDGLLMRFTDAVLALPLFFFLLAVVSLFGGGARTVVVVIGLTSWMRAARVVRGEFLRWKVQEFVLAARAQGATDTRIIVRHILPQAASSVMVEATLGVAYAILTESALSFLGLGIQPPTPTWGNMLFNAQSYIWMAPQLAIWPGCMILVTVLAFNSFGDGLRDALDPRTR
ncbi:MAG: ABC transporter permease, partial [Armatimonadetes bacterium]|nr:ABC transporter permease [Armatimonadota bacterium]